MKLSTIPNVYRHMNRWREIISTLSKYGLADWISHFEIDFIKGFLKDSSGTAIARQPREIRIRLALTDLGPTFIKLGQVLSTRPDVVGMALANELKKLQDDVPADDVSLIVKTIEEELGDTVENLFVDFDEQPLASASIGQVHRAKMKDGEEVVVKVLHHDVERRAKIDLDIIHILAQMAERRPELANYRPVSLAHEFQRIFIKEFDFRCEQRSLQQFHRLLKKNNKVCVPKVFPDFSSRRVLTMQYFDAVKLSHVNRSPPKNYDAIELARRGAELYLEMIFVHGRYHADPHPGNLVVFDDNVIGLLDFGMVGRIDERLREDVEEILISISDNDADTLTSIIMRIGEVPSDLDEAALELDISDFVNHFANQSLSDFDLSGALNEMMEIIRRYHISLPARIAMLVKVLVMLEGITKLINPHVNLMDLMRRHRRRMILRKLSPIRQLKKARRVYRELERLAQTLPRRMSDILKQVQSGKFDVHLDHRGLEPSVNRLVFGMLTSALFLGSSLLLSRKVPPLWGDTSILGMTGCIISILLGLRLIRAINKSGKLDRK